MLSRRVPWCAGDYSHRRCRRPNCVSLVLGPGGVMAEVLPVDLVHPMDVVVGHLGQSKAEEKANPTTNYALSRWKHFVVSARDAILHSHC